MVLGTILSKNIVKIIVTTSSFAIKNHEFANEQKWHVGKLRSWIIIISFSCRMTFVIFIVALAMKLSKLHYLFYLILQISIYQGLFCSQQLQMSGQMFLSMPILFQCFILNFWLIKNKQRETEIFHLVLSQWICPCHT